MLQANSAIPLYKQLKIALKNDILNSVYSHGDRIPSEQELEEKYGVSRITVRYALQELEEEGMLVRSRGKGTFVEHKKIQSDMRSIRGFTAILSEAGRNARRVIHSKTILPAEEKIAACLEIQPGDPVFEMKRTMSADNEPVMYEQVFYPANAYPGIIERVEENVSTYALLEAVYGVKLVRAHKQFNVDIADLEFSRLLGCKAGDPLFSIRKVVYDQNGRPVNLSRTWILADSVTYVLDVGENAQEDVRLQKREDL